MLDNIKSFFTIGNKKLKVASTIVFLSYVVLVTLPFISTPFPLLWKLTSTGGIITVVYRAIISLLFFAFYLSIAIQNKLKPNVIYLSFSVLMIIGTIIGFFAIPNSVTYGDGTVFSNGYLSNNHIFHFSYYRVGILTFLKS